MITPSSPTTPDRTAVAARRIRQNHADQSADHNAADQHQPAEAAEADQDAAENKQDEQPDVGPNVLPHLLFEDRVGREQTDDGSGCAIATAAVRAEDGSIVVPPRPAARYSTTKRQAPSSDSIARPAIQSTSRFISTPRIDPEVSAAVISRTDWHRDGLIAHDQQAVEQPATYQVEHPLDSEHRHHDLVAATAQLQDRTKGGPWGSCRGASGRQHQACNRCWIHAFCRRSAAGSAGMKCRSSVRDGDNTEQNPEARSPPAFGV